MSADLNGPIEPTPRDGFKVGAKQIVHPAAQVDRAQVLADLMLTCSAHALAELEKRTVNPGELRVSMSITWPAA